MENLEKVSPLRIVTVAITMASLLEQYLGLKDSLHRSLLNVEFSEDETDFLDMVEDLTIMSTDFPCILRNLERMASLALEDLREGINYYDQKETRELTQEELNNLTDADFPY